MPYKYIHINTKHMTQKNNKSIYQVNMNHHMIKNAKRVAVIKAYLPNSNFNVSASQGNNTITGTLKHQDRKVYNDGDIHYQSQPFTLTIPDGLYTIEELIAEINTQWSSVTMTASTQADTNFQINDPVQGTLNFSFIGSRVKVEYYNNLSIQKNPNANGQEFWIAYEMKVDINLLMKGLGFDDKIDEITFTQSSSETSPPDPFIRTTKAAEHIPTIENSPMYFIDSPELTDQNIYTIDENDNNEIKTGNHLLALLNNVPRYAYITYEASSPIFHELHKDITHFSLEIKDHNQKHFSQFNEFFCILAFEYEEPFTYYEQQRREYHSQGYAMAHKI